MANIWYTYNGHPLNSGHGICGKETLPPLQADTFRFEFTDVSFNPNTVNDLRTPGNTTRIRSWTWNHVKNGVWDLKYVLSSYSYSSDRFYQFLKNKLSKTNIGQNNRVRLIEAPTITSIVSDFRYMFQGCDALTAVALFDTGEAMNMDYMFYECSSLSGVPTFDTYDVSSMQGMFGGCSSLVNVPSFDTYNVTSMYRMFEYCTSLTSVPYLDATNTTNMGDMFEGCSSITDLSNLSSMDLSNVTDMKSMFDHCSSIVSIPRFNTAYVTNMNSMFSNCTNLTSVPLLSTRSATDVSFMFSVCSWVESGALALYQQMSTQTTPPSSHYSTFLGCGAYTDTGAAELAQIPSNWK